MNRIITADETSEFSKHEEMNADSLLSIRLQNFKHKIIVLDDDPTGIQTVNNISVYTDWSIEAMEAGFEEENKMFFILTNSRSFSRQSTAEVHREIALNALEVSKRKNKSFVIISRGDSTLRGHYPVETEVIKTTIEANSKIHYDGEVIIPYFKEGGRITIDNTHYVIQDSFLVPVGETEFAKDKTFGYSSSHLGEWVEEKTKGEFKAGNVTYITLEEIRKNDIAAITNKLMKVTDFNKIIVNAVEYSDLKIFTAALLDAMAKGKQFIFRTAASFARIISGLEERKLLKAGELLQPHCSNGGLVIVGSHVRKTSEQLGELQSLEDLLFIEFNVHLVLEDIWMESEIHRVIELCEDVISKGKTAVVYTKRELMLTNSGNKEDDLELSVKISGAVTSIVKELGIRPSYIIAKGGITSSDIGTKGLSVKKARVAGQIKPGIPVWITGKESKFPELPYIIFPGNVGTKTTLKEIISELNYTLTKKVKSS